MPEISRFYGIIVKMFLTREHNPLFDTVYVDCGGYSVAWTPDIDISEWELWDNGISI